MKLATHSLKGKMMMMMGNWLEIEYGITENQHTHTHTLINIHARHSPIHRQNIQTHSHTQAHCPLTRFKYCGCERVCLCVCVKVSDF